MPSSLVLAFAWNPVIGVPMAIVGLIVGVGFLIVGAEPAFASGNRNHAGGRM